MLFVLQQAARVNPRDDSWEHAVLWIVLAVVLVAIFLLAYFAFRFGWFKRLDRHTRMNHRTGPGGPGDLGWTTRPSSSVGRALHL